MTRGDAEVGRDLLMRRLEYGLLSWSERGPNAVLGGSVYTNPQILESTQRPVCFAESLPTPGSTIRVFYRGLGPVVHVLHPSKRVTVSAVTGLVRFHLSNRTPKPVTATTRWEYA